MSSTVASRCAPPRATQPIDVLYRRVDDDYLDPLNFKPESMLGVPGIMDVYRAGGITLANAPGTGIADDKAIYSYMPEIVEFYTGESRDPAERARPGAAREPDTLAYVLEHLRELVVKEVHGSGGYGMLVGPAASKRELAAFAGKLKASPGNYIAQPTLSLSTVPILTRQGLAPRHVDLRPFVLVSPDEIQITPGGLTRVALKQGFAGGQFQPGRRHQGHLGAGGIAMLGKTAGGLFWMFRYLERSENTARLLDAGIRIAMTRSSAAQNEWASILTTAGTRDAFLARHDDFEAGKVIDFLLRDRANPSSVLSVIEAARNNARLVRTALTREVWEATNECWIALTAILARPVSANAI